MKDDPYWIQIELHNKHISSYVKDDPYWIQIELHNKHISSYVKDDPYRILVIKQHEILHHQ